MRGLEIGDPISLVGTRGIYTDAGTMIMARFPHKGCRPPGAARYRCRSAYGLYVHSACPISEECIIFNVAHRRLCITPTDMLHQRVATLSITINPSVKIAARRTPGVYRASHTAAQNARDAVRIDSPLH